MPKTAPGTDCTTVGSIYASTMSIHTGENKGCFRPAIVVGSVYYTLANFNPFKQEEDAFAHADAKVREIQQNTFTMLKKFGYKEVK